MIPHYQRIAVCGEVSLAVLYELSQGGGLGHGLFAKVGLEAQYAVVLYLIYLVYLAAYYGVLPLIRAAGFHDYVDLIRKVGMEHLVYVRCGHTVVALKVGSAHVYHYGIHVLAAAPYLSALFPGKVGYGGVRRHRLGLGQLRLWGGGRLRLHQLYAVVAVAVVAAYTAHAAHAARNAPHYHIAHCKYYYEQYYAAEAAALALAVSAAASPA